MKKIIFASVLLVSSFLYSKEYTPEDAITKAFENNYEISRVNKELEIKKIDYKKSIKQLYPKLSFSSSFVKLNDDISLLGRTIANSDLTYSNKLVLQQPVFVGGAIFNGIKYLQINEDLVLIQREQKKREVRLNILQTYMSIIKSMKNKEILENSLKELNDTYKNLNERLELDIIQKKPVLDVNYRLLEVKSNLVSINNEIEIKKMTLKNLMGLSKDESIEIKDLEIPKVDFSTINLDKDIFYATSNKATIKSLEISKQVSEINKNIKKADLLPKVYFRFNYEAYGKEYGSSTSGTWNASLSTSLNLFDFGITHDDIEKSKKEIEQKELDKKNTTEKIDILIKSNYFDLERLKNIIDIKTEALESSKENYRIEKLKAELEMDTASDLLTAENDFRKVEIELINARMDLYISYLKYIDTIEREAI